MSNAPIEILPSNPTGYAPHPTGYAPHPTGYAPNLTGYAPPQIRLNTTLNDKSNWIRTKFDWIRLLPPPKALNSRHWGFTGVQAVCHEKHMQQYQLTQQNLNQIKTEKLQRHLKKLRESM